MTSAPAPSGSTPARSAHCRTAWAPTLRWRCSTSQVRRERLAAWFRTRYDQTAPATRVRQLAILRSACAFWRRRAWITTDPTTELDRPRVPLDRTKALTRDQIASLWRRDDVALRERVFWRLLYESAARANEILSLNIEDLDLGQQARPCQEQRWRHRVGVLANRRCTAAAPPAGWSHHWPGVPR